MTAATRCAGQEFREEQISGAAEGADRRIGELINE